MTGSIIISSSTQSVDITDLNPSFTFDFNNPIIKIPTPMDTAEDLSNVESWNVITLNLNFSTQTIMLEFTETSGIGVLGSAIQWKQNPTTVFEKILHMAGKQTETKTISINGQAFCQCHIEGYRASVDPGRLDLVRHSLTLCVASQLSEGISE